MVDIPKADGGTRLLGNLDAMFLSYPGEETLFSHAMSEFDYTVPAELFSAHGRTGLRYRSFSNSAEAIRHAVEKLPAAALLATSLQVDDYRYSATEIRALYDSEQYPLTRSQETA